jgi:hypothetical protein
MKKTTGYGSNLLFFTILMISIALLSARKNVAGTDFCPKTKRAKPNMWVAKNDGIGYEKNFDLKQHKQLSDQMQGVETSSLYYPIKSFRQIMNMVINTPYKFMQVYIVAYDSGADVPLQLQGKLTILFHPALDSAEEGAPYFAIKPDGSIYEEKNADRYKAEYEKYKLPVLKLNLDASQGYNTSSSGVVSDTKKITYDSSDIADLMREIDYQVKTNGITTNGIEAIFSSYPSTGHPKSNRFVNRIFVLYEFTRSVGGKNPVYYIDDQKDFCYRKDPVKPDNGIMLTPTSVNLYSVDNGQLCPPNCP